jgi:uncharacterized protein YndB with AHSA1/START domain
MDERSDAPRTTPETTGLTKDAGWELGVRRTIDVSLPRAWEYLMGPGLSLWLGDIDDLPTKKGDGYETKDGVRGSIRGYSDGYRVRLSWKPSDWPHDTTLQLTVKKVATGTTVAIHHEHLVNREERKMMLGHWSNVMDAIEDALAR